MPACRRQRSGFWKSSSERGRPPSRRARSVRRALELARGSNHRYYGRTTILARRVAKSLMPSGSATSAALNVAMPSEVRR